MLIEEVEIIRKSYWSIIFFTSAGVLNSLTASRKSTFKPLCFKYEATDNKPWGGTVAPPILLPLHQHPYNTSLTIFWVALVDGFKIHDGDDFNNKELNEKVDIIIKMLYQERCDFVHSARFPQIYEEKGGYLNTILGYYKIGDQSKYVSIKISIDDIKDIFEKAFIKFLESKIKNT